MDELKIIKENKDKNDERGTYVYLALSDDTLESIMDFIEQNEINNPVEKKHLHSTLLMTKKNINPDNFEKVDDLLNWVGTPIGLKIKTTSFGTKALMLVFDCDEQKERHEQIKKQYNVEHSFKDYMTHITLSYDAGDIDISRFNVEEFKDISFSKEVCRLDELKPKCVESVTSKYKNRYDRHGFVNFKDGYKPLKTLLGNVKKYILDKISSLNKDKTHRIKLQAI